MINIKRRPKTTYVVSITRNEFSVVEFALNTKFATIQQ